MKEITRNATNCYCVNVRRASNAITELYDNELKLVGLSQNQYSILNNISKLKTCGLSELSNFMGLERTTLVRGMKPLIEKGYIKEIQQEKKNKKMIELTNEGKVILEDARLLWNKAQNKVESTLSEKESEELVRLLNKIEKI